MQRDRPQSRSFSVVPHLNCESNARLLASTARHVNKSPNLSTGNVDSVSFQTLDPASDKGFSDLLKSKANPNHRNCLPFTDLGQLNRMNLSRTLHPLFGDLT